MRRTPPPSPGPGGAWLLATLLVVSWLLAGCAVPMQSEPDAIPPPATESRERAPSGGAVDATLFLVDAARLAPVRRATTEDSPRALLLLLAGGPTASESGTGLRSALVPRSLHPAMFERGPRVRAGVLEVAATERFARLAGEDQLLATAQLVWTVTGASSAHAVRVLVSGVPIELPTDDGLTDGPVTRTDYLSVAPLAPSSDAGITLERLVGAVSAPVPPQARQRSDGGTTSRVPSG